MKPVVGLGPTAPPAEAPARSAVADQVREVARQFEGIFLRQLLAPLERGFGAEAAGSQVYGSLALGAAADAAIAGGGIGLAEVLARAMMDALPPDAGGAGGPAASLAGERPAKRTLGHARAEAAGVAGLPLPEPEYRALPQQSPALTGLQDRGRIR